MKKSFLGKRLQHGLVRFFFPPLQLLPSPTLWPVPMAGTQKNTVASFLLNSSTPEQCTEMAALQNTFPVNKYLHMYECVLLRTLYMEINAQVQPYARGMNL